MEYAFNTFVDVFRTGEDQLKKQFKAGCNVFINYLFCRGAQEATPKNNVGGKAQMEKILKIFEKVIVLALLGLMMIAVLISTVELAVILFQELIKPPLFLLNIEEMLEVFGFFLMVLIGLELLESIKAYIEEDRVHAEIVFLVAIVAVSRKIIILNYNEITAEKLYGMAAVIAALGIGYFLVRRALYMHTPRTDKNPPTQN